MVVLKSITKLNISFEHWLFSNTLQCGGPRLSSTGFRKGFLWVCDLWGENKTSNRTNAWLDFNILFYVCAKLE